jgi:hypothetical protein
VALTERWLFLRSTHEGVATKVRVSCRRNLGIGLLIRKQGPERELLSLHELAIKRLDGILVVDQGVFSIFELVLQLIDLLFLILDDSFAFSHVVKCFLVLCLDQFDLVFSFLDLFFEVVDLVL